jgi:hypothetical protein
LLSSTPLIDRSFPFGATALEVCSFQSALKSNSSVSPQLRYAGTSKGLKALIHFPEALPIHY